MSDDDSKVQRALGRIEGELKFISGMLRAMNDNHDGHDGRLRKLENKQWFIAGIAATIGSIIGHFIPR